MLSVCIPVILSVLGLLTCCHASMASWPVGKYAVLKPQEGCPRGWPQKTGWIYQDTEDTNPGNERSKVLHIDGYVSKSYVLRSFCVKTNDAGTSWPKGQYCVYNKYYSSCPGSSSMLAGQIRWDDENNKNQNRFVGPLPYVNNHLGNLRLSFCCANNGDRSVPIQLPTSSPFYLLPFNSSRCQQVEWMTAAIEWIKYDRENTGTDYSDQSGTVPYYTLSDDRDITMYYCYYESCNYTLDSTNGSFHSPNFPNNYTDGQVCSWKIKVPSNHTINIAFNTFDLDITTNNDSLEYYTMNNGTYKMVHRYHGNDIPTVVTSDSSDVMFVFRTDKEFNSHGFSAQYEVFPTEDYYKTTTTTTIEPTTMKYDTTQTNTEHVATSTPTNDVSTLSSEEPSAHVPAKASACENSSTMILIAIPVACFTVVVVILIDIWCRCRHRYGKRKHDTKLSPDMAVNGIYDCEMMVTPCSTITRPTVHHDQEGSAEIYQNTAFCPDNQTPHYSTSLKSDTCLEPIENTRQDDSDSCGYIEATERGPKVDSEDYGYIESHGDTPRVVSGEYGYLEPLGYIPRVGSVELPTETRKDSDRGVYSKPLKILDDVQEVNDVINVPDDEPIYEYDNACELLGADEDIYASVDD